VPVYISVCELCVRAHLQCVCVRYIVLLVCIGSVVSTDLFKEQFDLTALNGPSDHPVAISSVYQYVLY